MSDAPNDPYRSFGEPEQPGSEPEPVWGSDFQYPPYTPPQAHPPAPGGYPPVVGGYPPAPGGYPPPYGAQPSYQPGYQPPPYPYGPGNQWSDKKKPVAGLLQLLLPFVFVCGVGRLYSGHTAIGLLQLIGYFAGFLFLPFALGIWLWSVIDGIIMLAGQPRDGQGRLLRP